MKLIRSKGVGVFFCTQLPTDVPNAVLSQLGARVQHALRAFTPDDQKALAQTVKTCPTPPHYDLGKALTTLGIGEAVVTVLSEQGTPTPVAWTRLRPPRSLMASIGVDAVKQEAASSSLTAKYSQSVDRESAYEMLLAKVAPPAQTQSQEAQPEGESAPAARRKEADDPGLIGQVLGNPAVKSFLWSAGSALGWEITRGIFGTGRRR